MNQMHPDTRFEIHRSYQSERLAHSLQERPEGEPRKGSGAKLLIFVTFLVISISGYVLI